MITQTIYWYSWVQTIYYLLNWAQKSFFAISHKPLTTVRLCFLKNKTKGPSKWLITFRFLCLKLLVVIEF